MRSARPVINGLRGAVKRAYDRTVKALESEGCRAGGYRMQAVGGGDARVCCKRFYRDWRMHLFFDEDDHIAVSFVGRHSDEENIHRTAAEVVPELSDVGRPREEQPPCCEDLDDPPAAPELVELVLRLA